VIVLKPIPDISSVDIQIKYHGNMIFKYRSPINVHSCLNNRWTFHVGFNWKTLST